MTLTGILARTEKLLADNSPQILTALGVAGTVTTAILTGKASFKAAQILNEVNPDHIAVYPDEPGEYTVKEKVKLTWKLYLPPVAVGALTVASIITASRIGTRRAAAMAAAYAVSERAFSEYKEQVIKKFGEVKEQNVRDSVRQEQMNKNPVSDRQIIIAGGNVLCYEPYTDRYFDSDMESIKKAQNDLNYRINNNWYASLSEFYDLVGLPHTHISDELGWKADKLLDIDFGHALATDGRPCLVINYVVEPIRDYYKVH
jgi:hypothetical protein